MPSPFRTLVDRLNPFARTLSCRLPGSIGSPTAPTAPVGPVPIPYPNLGTRGPIGISHPNAIAAPFSILPKTGDEPASGAESEPAKRTLGPLEVSQGQVTFDAEGNDNPKSVYFSRKLHWPGGLSGVTIGRGYDMGKRLAAGVESDLLKAGMLLATAKLFAKGAGLTGQEANKFVANYRDTLGEITHAVQKALFENIYPDYVERARGNYGKWTENEKGKVAWEKLHWAIRDILVDFVYQGFTKGPNPMVRGCRNDFDELIDYIETSTAFKQYEKGRRRAAYLKKHRGSLGDRCPG